MAYPRQTTSYSPSGPCVARLLTLSYFVYFLSPCPLAAIVIPMSGQRYKKKATCANTYRFFCVFWVFLAIFRIFSHQTMPQSIDCVPQSDPSDKPAIAVATHLPDISTPDHGPCHAPRYADA